MAVEPNTANESAAELQDPAPGVLLTDEDLESPSKKRKVGCKHVCTLMCMILLVPNMFRVSHSGYVMMAKPMVVLSDGVVLAVLVVS